MSTQPFTYFSVCLSEDKTKTVVAVVVAETRVKKRWDAAKPLDQRELEVARINVGGVVSVELAQVWGKQICDQLNRAHDAALGIAALYTP